MRSIKNAKYTRWMSVFRTYTTGFYNTLKFASEAKSLRLFQGEKWILDLPDQDKLCLYINTPAEDSKKHVIIVIHGLAGAAMDPSVVSVTEKFLKEGYPVVRMNLRGSGAGAGLARHFYHAGRDEDLVSVVKGVLERFPGHSISMVGMSLSSNIMFRYLAKEKSSKLSCAIALSPVIDLQSGSEKLSSVYFGMINNVVLSILKSYFIKRKRAYNDVNLPDWNVIKKMWQFDDLFIAPECGFKNAEEYYSATSALPYLKSIKANWKAVLCLDDPIASAEKKFLPRDFPDNSVILPSGGHLYMGKYGGLGEVAYKIFKEMA